MIKPPFLLKLTKLFPAVDQYFRVRAEHMSQKGTVLSVAWQLSGNRTRIWTTVCLNPSPIHCFLHVNRDTRAMWILQRLTDISTILLLRVVQCLEGQAEKLGLFPGLLGSHMWDELERIRVSFGYRNNDMGCLRTSLETKNQDRLEWGTREEEGEA